MSMSKPGGRGGAVAFARAPRGGVVEGGAPAFVKAASDRSRNVAERWWARRDHQVIVTRSKDNRQNALSNEGTAEAGGGGGAVKLGAI